MKTDTTKTRRSFLKAAAAATAVPTIASSCALGRAGRKAPSERITIGAIGVGQRGVTVMREALAQPDAQVIAVCDPFRERREAARNIVEKVHGATRSSGTFKGCSMYNDFRELLDRRDIDAVYIATQDRWHAYQAIAAIKARKDVYLEKPLTNTYAQGEALVKALRGSDRVLQVGQQQRSGDHWHFRHACELVRNGRIGRLRTIKIGVWGGIESGPVPDPQPVPEGLDYDLWLGPAPYRPYSDQRVSNSRGWWHIYDYTIGFQAGWGVHHWDIALWGAGELLDGPVEVEGKAVFPREGLCDTPLRWRTDYVFPSAVHVIFSTNELNAQGIRFEGEDGWIFVSRDRFDADPKSLMEEKVGEDEIRLERSANHQKNFLDAVRGRRDPVAPVEVGHRANVMCILSDIATRLGRPVHWEPKRQHFRGDADADRMLARREREPWGLA